MLSPFAKLGHNPRLLFVCALVGSVLLLGGIVLGLFVIPNFIENKIWDETKVLKEGTESYNIFLKFPFPFTFKVYMFNVENADDVLNGAKPVVREIGPYVYKLFRWKSEIEWNSTDEVSYNDYMRFEFDQSASWPLSEDDQITTLFTPYNSMLLTIESMAEDMLPTIEPILPQIFGANADLFVKLRVKDYLFDGVPLCVNEGKAGGFTANMICKQLMSRVKETKPMWIVNNNTVMFANFHFKNNTHLGRFKVKSGQTNKYEAGSLVSYDHKDYMDSWKGNKSTCNKIYGMTTIFPVNIQKDMVFEVYAEDVCRVMSMDFKETVLVKDIEAFRFSALNSTFSATKNNDCFCINRTRLLHGEYGCTDGLLDLTTCAGAPVMLSFPHLLHANRQYLESVDGLDPDVKKHESYVAIEPIAGVPLELAKRVQFNMFIRPIPGIERLENVSQALVPIFWVEESTILPDKYVDELKTKLLGPLKWIEIGRWVIMITGLVIVLSSFFLYIYYNE